MIWLIIILIGWVIGIPIAYNIIKKWENKSKGEKVYFSVIWPLTALLYSIHWIHNK